MKGKGGVNQPLPFVAFVCQESLTLCAKILQFDNALVEQDLHRPLRRISNDVHTFRGIGVASGFQELLELIRVG